MSRPKQKGQKSEMDEMLDEALGEVAVDADAGPAEAAPEKPERVEAKEPEPEPAQVEKDDEAEPVEAKPATEIDAELKRERELREASERQSAAIRRELVEMRAKLRAQSQRTEYAPNPSQPAPPTQPEPRHEAPAPLRGEDLIQFQNGQIGLNVDKLQQLIDQRAAQATMPDPREVQRQRVASEYQKLKDEFVGENPALHSQAMSHVEQAYEFMSLASQAKAQEWGVDLGRLNFDGKMDFLNTSGVMGEVAQRFPHLAPEFPELLRSDALESREGMRTVLRRYAQQLTTVLGGAAATPTQSQPAPSRPLYQPPTNAPPDLSKVGSGTPEPNRAERERLAELEKLEAKDPLFGMSAGELKEMERLRRKFKVDDVPWGIGVGR